MSGIDWLKAEWDRISGFGCIGLGGLLVLFGYLGASNSTHTPEVLSYLISGGIGGLFLLGVGATLLVSADLHDEWRKLDRLEDAFRSGVLGSPSSFAAADDDTAVDLTGPGQSRAEERNGTAELQRTAARTHFIEASSHGPAAVNADLSPARRARALAAAGLVVAVLPITLGWNHAASRLSDGPAMDGVSMATVGLILAGLAVAMPTWSMRRTVRSRAGRLLNPFFRELDGVTDEIPARSADARSASPTGTVLVAEGLSRYHAAGCPAVRGVTGNVREMPRSEVPATLTPCQLCLAD
jgi:hypothetical protein